MPCFSSGSLVANIVYPIIYTTEISIKSINILQFSTVECATLKAIINKLWPYILFKCDVLWLLYAKGPTLHSRSLAFSSCAVEWVMCALCTLRKPDNIEWLMYCVLLILRVCADYVSFVRLRNASQFLHMAVDGVSRRDHLKAHSYPSQDLCQ